MIVTSVLVNYALGVVLATRAASQDGPRKRLLAVGVSANLGLLAYFKYANFFVDNVRHLFHIDVEIGQIVLPLAISFFTFQQIAYLVDAHRRLTREYNFLHYCLFVTFFPQLIAGPIVHHGEMLPQFGKETTYRLNRTNLEVGVTFFLMGLFKKVVIADGIARYGTPVFDAAQAGLTIDFWQAWAGALAYTFQIYFDFSGYSDMAIGIARMFGIKLPLNFHSPYKATSVIEFWRRWHMTLSRFLRDYLYIPLGGNRKGPGRRHANLMVTMLLGGLWHGAGWTFMYWGGLHGLYLILNHAWRTLRRSFGHDLSRTTLVGTWIARLTVFVAVVVAWVFFRATSFAAALTILAGMAGRRGFALSNTYAAQLKVVADGSLIGAVFPQLSPESLLAGSLTTLFILVWLLPNTQQLMADYEPALEVYKDNDRSPALRWRPTTLWAALLAGAGVLAILGLTSVSEFLYFQF